MAWHAHDEPALSVASGKARSSPRPAALRVGFGPVLFRIAVVAIYAFLLGPIIIIIATSFDPTTAAAFPPKGFTLHWYGEFLRSGNFTDAFKFSLYLGVLAAIAATAIGFVTAYAIVRCLGNRRELGQSLALLPAVIPQILISISLLLVLSFVPFPPFAALLAGHVVICLPFAIAGISASLDGVDEQLEAAALTLGASRLRVLQEIVVPLAAPGILSALVFAFIVSFGDVYIALFLSGPGMTTLPVEIFSYMQWESTPVVAAITTLQVIMIIALGLLVERLVGLRKMMRF